VGTVKPPKLRWLLLLGIAYAIWRNCRVVPPAANPALDQGPSAAEPLADGVEAEPTPDLTPDSFPQRIRRAPRRRARRLVPKKFRAQRSQAAEGSIVIETPTPQPPSPAFSPGPRPSPGPLQEASLLESVAFKDEEEVLERLGEADETMEGDEGRMSWYYSRPALSRQGKPVCPEVRFIDGQARMVIMWTPDKMREMIATVRDQKSEGSKSPSGPQTFTFLDSFKYLGVGTPQETVLEDLGEPDSKKAAQDGEEWNYDTLIVENGASRRLTVVLQKGKVFEVRGR
jgi:hypothetical protein